MKNKTYIIILLIIIILYFLFYKYINTNLKIENFENNSINTVCVVWNNKINNKAIHGFGDKLRGAIYLYRYFKNLNKNIKIVVDGSHDICGDILINVTTSFSEKIKTANINYIFDSVEHIFPDISDIFIEEDNVIYIYTNFVLDNKELSDEEKEFAKFISEPKDNIKNEITNKLNKIPNIFTIKHFRFNDTVLKHDIDITDSTFSKFFEILKKNYKDTDILFTNSNNFTKYANQKLNIKFIDCNNEICKVGHIGESNEYDSVKNSFIEFYIIGKSKMIHSYTVYGWPSNFVYWTAKIYNIPFESIENL